ncbi:50S ribosomal protein L2 [Candidatus Parcubacteria bacterium]|nr:50S ribosomal protein L2 [Candidatus Parcubacteria bacterium]
MKKYKPTSEGRRGMTVVSYKEVITRSTPEKSLTKGFRRGSGRNNQGRITTRHKGGGVKRKYRDIDFNYNKIDIPAKITSIEYDPNRSAYIMLAVYADGEKRYVIAPKGMKVDDKFVVSEDAPIELGNRLILRNIPVGTFVHNVETKPKGGAKLARSAGNFLQVVANDNGYTSIKMPSTEVRKVVDSCWATIGTVSNDEWKLTNFGKAGRNRHRGIRPTVRGSVMNPVDHPHGGGEGKQGIGLRRGPKTRQGKLAYGVKTRRAKKYSNRLIVNRRKTKR